MDEIRRKIRRTSMPILGRYIQWDIPLCMKNSPSRRNSKRGFVMILLVDNDNNIINTYLRSTVSHESKECLGRS